MNKNLPDLAKSYKNWFNFVLVLPISFLIFIFLFIAMLATAKNPNLETFFGISLLILVPFMIIGLIGYVFIYFILSHIMFMDMKKLDPAIEPWLYTAVNVIGAFLGIVGLIFGFFIFIKIRDLWKANSIQYKWNLKAIE